MINIKYIEVRNYKSYGDYPTRIEVDGLGPTLIMASNGAGKTSILESIIWCLFGRTISRHNPGDVIVNWHVGQDCYVELGTTDGYKIIRTRKMAGHNDLLIKDPNGEDFSKGINAQKELENLFNLDYEIFVTGTFFAQFGQPLLELPDVKRKKMIERMLHVSRLSVYSDIAKTKLDKLDQDQGTTLSKRGDLTLELEKLSSQREKYRNKKDGFDEERQNKIQSFKDDILLEQDKHDNEADKLRNDIKLLRNELAGLKFVDRDSIDKLTKRWDAYNKAKRIVEKKKTSVSEKTYDVRRITDKIHEKQDLIEEWQGKEDTHCSECEQEVDGIHVKSKVDPIRSEVSDLEKSMVSLKVTIKTVKDVIEGAEKKLSVSEPKQSIDTLRAESRSVQAERSRILSQIDSKEEKLGSLGSILKENQTRIGNRIDEIEREENPYGVMIDDLNDQITSTTSQCNKMSSKIEKTNVLLRHLKYIYGAYHDRKKIKSFMLSYSIPYLNTQIEKYLRKFNIRGKLWFNNYLQVNSDKWPYDLHSGGERRRIDMATMFSFRNLHEVLFGRPSNIIVLDEVDGRLDDDGIDEFISEIGDLSSEENGPSTILIISHKDSMKDAFSSKIQIDKDGDFSFIDEVRS